MAQNDFDYIDHLKKAAKFVWDYKVIWLFGFLAAFFSGAVNTNFSYSTSDTSSYSSGYYSDYQTGSEAFEEMAESFDELFSSPEFIIMLVVAVVFSVIWALVAWYFRSVAKVSMINAARYDYLGKRKEIGIKELWSESHGYLLNVILYGLLWIVIKLPVFIVVGVLLLLLIILGPVGWIFCCLVLPLGIILIIALNVVSSWGYRLLVLRRTDPMSAIREGFEFLKKNLGQVIVSFLLLFLVEIPFIIVIGILSMVITFPLAFATEGLIASGEYLAAFLIALGVGIILKLVVAVIISPLGVLIEGYWTKLVMEMDDEVKELG